MFIGFFFDKQNCSAEDGLMRMRRDVPLSHTVSYGPIRRLLTDKEKTKFSKLFFSLLWNLFSSYEPQQFKYYAKCGLTCVLWFMDEGGVPPVETFVLGGLLVVLLLITGVFGRLWLRSRRFYPAQEAQLTLSNIHHISEVAS